MVVLNCSSIVEVFCSAPISIDHASLNSFDTRVGSRVDYSCHPGYRVADDVYTVQLECLESGEWFSEFNVSEGCHRMYKQY